MCNCNVNHYVKNTTASATNVILEVSDSTNISTKDCFNIVVCKNIGECVTGTPMPVQVNVNGEAVNLLNKYALPVLSDKLPCRNKYCGAYVVPTTGAPYVILFSTPKCKCNA